MISTIKRTLAVAALSALLSACAQTGQQVTLVPHDDYAKSQIGQGDKVRVEVHDMRTDKTLGVLKNKDAPPARITPRQSVENVLKLELSNALEANGFAPEFGTAQRSRVLELQVLDLYHEVAAAVPRNSTTRVKLKIVAHHNGQSLAQVASTTHNDHFLHRPSAEENADLINRTLSQTLSRLLTPEIMQFLKSGPK